MYGYINFGDCYLKIWQQLDSYFIIVNYLCSGNKIIIQLLDYYYVVIMFLSVYL